MTSAMVQLDAFADHPSLALRLWARLGVCAARAEATDPAQADRATHDDHADVHASRDGDGDAYARLIARYQPTVAAVMRRFTRDRTEWERLVQDVFVEAYFALASYRGDGSFEGWLRTIATRVGYRYWKQRDRQRVQAPLRAEEWDALAAVERGQRDVEPAEAGALLHRLLAQLPPRDRLVLTLVYFEGCSVAQAAERTGWSRTMVKVQAHRAREKLKRLLEAHGVTREAVT